MSSYTLHYFDVDARAELIRLIFAYGGIEFKDVVYSFEEWPSVKGKFPFQTLPVLEIDGKQLAQSSTIVRYLARVAGIDGRTSLERAKADMYTDAFAQDIVDKTYSFRVPFLEPDPEKRKIKGEEFIKEKLIPFFKQLEETFEKNGGGPWFCGDTFTYADLAFFRLINNVQSLLKDSSIKHPSLYAVYKRVAEIPRIAEYQKNKKERPF
ncbi:expressed hypothetical protein [Trichoplax adhaerens]|uniref:glutathione transferase n=1 Tax=Trichoplax adhaerens TaxID=10228 RepID=B3RU75_TRIAD|nr:expressed hypothetical protein [Trichoplax adhaerens]EDV25758.1 expressed hypothetical protein [Trichoplax adhaerens]|eukprot:XP_002111791.1 expressed hypothetical protein [Trichoplax adhaerens]